MEENRFVWDPKRYFICTICGCFIVAVEGAEIASARCHHESCREIDVHHHPFELPTTNNFFLNSIILSTATAATP